MEMRSTAGRTAADDGEERRKSRIELSGAQVAGGASATMVAAFLASSMGVYGTIIGAGVVSVGATAGGALFQHVFRRTGEQLKDAAVAAPKVLHKQTTPLPAPVPNRADDATQPLPLARPAADDATQPLRAARPAADDATQLLPTARPRPDAPAPTGVFGAASTHGTRGRARGWRRLGLVAAGTFVAVMAVVFGIEKLTGGPLSNAWGDDRTGTTFSPGERKSDSPPADDGGAGTTDDTGPGAGEAGEPGGSSDSDSDAGTGSDSRPGDGSAGEDADDARQPGGTPTPQQPGDGGDPAPGTGGGATPAPTPTPTAPETGDDGAETPGTGEPPAVPEQDGETAPEATR